MAKLDLRELVTLENDTSAVNNINLNSQDIEAAVENTLSRDGTTPNTMEAELDMNSNFIVNLPEPTDNQHATTKNYVDARSLDPNVVTEVEGLVDDAEAARDAAQLSEANAATSESNAANSALQAEAAANGMKWKPSAKAATTANITLSGAQTIDGVSIVADDIVLVKDQTTASENGLYIASASAWTRHPTMDAWDEVPSAATSVEEGTLNGDLQYICLSDQGGTIGVTDIVWGILGSPTTVDEVTLTKVGTEISIKDDGVGLTQLTGGTANTVIGFDVSGDPVEISSASQAEQEAGTAVNVFVTPANFKFNQGSVKAWINLDQTAQTAGVNLDGVRDSLNIASVVGGAAGRSTLNFTNVFSTADYSVGGFASENNNNPRIRFTSSMAVGSYVYSNENTSGTGSDCEFDFVQILGDLA